MHVPEPQGPKPARQLSPAEREGSIQKRQAEVNTVLMAAGVHSGKRDRILDGGPTSPTHCKAPGGSRHGQGRCGRSGAGYKTAATRILGRLPRSPLLQSMETQWLWEMVTVHSTNHQC